MSAHATQAPNYSSAASQPPDLDELAGNTAADRGPSSAQSSAPPLTQALTPSQRLAVSRERLRRAMTSEGSGRGRKRASRDGQPDDQATDTGGGAFSTFVHLATQWWESHPLREVTHIASNVAAPAANALLAPMARRHPWRLVLVAAGVGGAIVWARPWRWLPQAALSSALVSSIWPRGGLSRWLASGGLISLVTSSEVRQWLAKVLDEHAQGSGTAGSGDASSSAASSASSSAESSTATESPSAGEASDTIGPQPQGMQGRSGPATAP